MRGLYDGLRFALPFAIIVVHPTSKKRMEASGEPLGCSSGDPQRARRT
jgi:hypothetical protein